MTRCEISHWPHPEFACLFSLKSAQLYAIEVPSRVSTLPSFATLFATRPLTTTSKISATIQALTRADTLDLLKRFLSSWYIRSRHKFCPPFFPILSSFLPFCFIYCNNSTQLLLPNFLGFFDHQPLPFRQLLSFGLLSSKLSHNFSLNSLLLFQTLVFLLQTILPLWFVLLFF